ncbi:MAG: hypothetical protein JXB32_12130 [Deltaproteobacteria bacterium]|nr:hypothetical protein [Deltaproteobacteria bacterium]
MTDACFAATGSATGKALDGAVARIAIGARVVVVVDVEAPWPTPASLQRPRRRTKCSTPPSPASPSVPAS